MVRQSHYGSGFERDDQPGRGERHAATAESRKDTRATEFKPTSSTASGRTGEWRRRTCTIKRTSTENPTTPALVGKWLPQVPAHRGSLRLAYSNPRPLHSVAGVQFVGSQFDDDLNTPSRRLPKFAVVDIMASRAVGRTLEIFAGVQNLFDEEYFVGTLPTTVGTPRLVTGGVRVRRALTLLAFSFYFAGNLHHSRCPSSLTCCRRVHGRIDLLSMRLYDAGDARVRRL